MIIQALSDTIEQQETHNLVYVRSGSTSQHYLVHFARCTRLDAKEVVFCRVGSAETGAQGRKQW